MRKNRLSLSAFVLGTSLLGVSLLAATGAARSATAADNRAEGPGETVQAVWQPQEISFHYMGFTSAYNCDALADKVEDLLRQLGVHESVKARGGGCALNRPEKTVALRITAFAPIDAKEADKQETASNEKRAALLKRLGVNTMSSDPFPARWQTVTLSDNTSSSMSSGDCELLEQFRDQVLPKLHVKLIKSDVRCTPHQVNIGRHRLTVSALMPVKTGS